MSLASYLRAAPKVELHVHLEGSIRPATLLDLAHRHGRALPARDVAGVRDWYRFDGFDHFVEVLMAGAACLREAADFERVTFELGEDLRRQNVRYAEVTTSPSVHRYHGVAAEAHLGGIARGRERVRTELGVELAWVFDIVRNIPDPGRWQEADRTLALALDGRPDGVVALGFAGIESGYPAAPFRPWFERARAADLHITPHAGETAGAGSVWDALAATGARRIGHGVRAIEDPALVERLAGEGIVLELCPTSNLRLGVVASLAAHPLPRLVSAGVAVTVNTDDPALFQTTLGDELLLLSTAFRLDLDSIDRILLEGARASFLPPVRKAALVGEMEAELSRLRREHRPEAG